MLGCTLTRLYSQSSGDFRSKQSGIWNQTATWQRYNGATWENALYTPTYSDGVITIQTGHTVTVTADVDIDQTTVNGKVIINNSQNFEVRNGSGTDLTVNGTLENHGTLDNDTYNSTISYGSGGVYQHAQNGGTIEDATWDTNALCEVTGVTSSDPNTSSYNQQFGCFTWNCTSQSVAATTGGNLTIVNGHFRIKSTGTGSLKLSSSQSTTLTIGGGFFLSGGYFLVTGGSANNVIIVQGDSMKITAGTLTRNGSGSDNAIIRFNKSGQQYFEKSEGTISGMINFEVLSGTTLDLDSSILGDPLYSSGTFTLNYGGGIRTRHNQGISTTYATGCIQVTGIKTYSSGAYYTFYADGSQATGNGLPGTLNANLIIGSMTAATALTLTGGSVTINQALHLYSKSAGNSSVIGTVVYGTSGYLYYEGMSAQTTTNAEFPSVNGPKNLSINNSYGVSLHTSRTLTGTLSLQQGAFSIGANTLTLNGEITKYAGSLTGGSTSRIIFGGSGDSTCLPAVTLNELTINRTSGIGLLGNVTVLGTCIMTSGPLYLKTSTLSYGSSATLKYNGTSLQTTTSAEFPATSGPFNLYSDNNTGVNLHASRTLEGTLTLNKGTFSIQSNTLSLNGALSINTGSLSGGSSSSIIFGGTGGSTSLPGITLLHLTINRPAGITLGGNVTLGGTLTLQAGPLSIGSTTLTINGPISQTGGSLTGGTSSNMVFGGSGSGTILPSVTLYDLDINRVTATISMAGDVTVHHKLSLLSGSLAILSNNLTINGEIYKTSGQLSGGSYSNMIFGGSGVSTGLPEVTLHDLTINRAAGITQAGNVTVEGTLYLIAGNLSIGANTLNMNGSISYTSHLTGGATSVLTCGGTGPALSLAPITLQDMNVYRAAGVSLTGDVAVMGTLSLFSGPVIRNGYYLYGPAATLRYSGVTQQTTSNEEWPVANGPQHINSSNIQGVLLHDDRTVNGILTLTLGSFAIGNHTLTLNGMVNQNPMASLTGGLASNLIISGGPDATGIPGVILNNLTLERPGGAWLSGVIMEPGARLSTGHPLGVSGTLSLACPKTIDSATDYIFNGTINQVSNFLPTSTPNTIRHLVISNSGGANVTITDSMTLTGTLDIMNGAKMEVSPLIFLVVQDNVTIH